MRLYLDQMIHPNVVLNLTRLGHDVQSAESTGLDRSSDQEIMSYALGDRRTLVTLDEHFGNWAVLPLSEHFGVIRIKVHPTTSPNILSILLPFIGRVDQESLRNHLIIISPRGERWIDTSHE